jgi:DNA mismatch repair protein MutL
MSAVPRPPIRVLPSSAAERIAAGEVVERPASVVKELIENSLDAGARRITVEIEGAGRRLIRVTDDGDGIPAAELPLAFERFATSKIRAAADLTRIRTYGFRGEALPSIAAVSRVEVVTRPPGQEDGARIVVTGSASGGVLPAGGAEGTRVTVEDLFFNTPARKAFLKSEARETGVVIETVEAISLAAPGVAFRLLDGGREVLWAPSESFAARARRILGPRLSDHALDLEAVGEIAEIRGVLGTPQVAEARRAHEWFLVNGRPVRSPLLARALTEAYHTLIPDDRHPVAILSVHVRPEDVDVNIHPRKAEVRFVREAAVFEAVVRAVRGALRRASLVHIVPADTRIPAAGPLPEDHAMGPEDSVGAVPAPPLPGTLWSAEEAEDAWPEIRLIGQLALTYLVGESGGDLILIDQHAAHERVLFEQLMDRRAAGGVPSQGLVTPAILEVSRAEDALLAEIGPALRGFGFEVEPFGRDVVRLTAVPALAAARAPEDVFRACLRDLTDGLATRGPQAGRDLMERLAIATACHTAVRAGDRLDPPMMARLLADLAQARDPFSCFHGRPTIVRVRGRDLERWFYRRV